MISRRGAKAQRENSSSIFFSAFAPLRDSFLIFSFAISIASIASVARAEERLDGEDGRPLALEEFRPRSSLVHSEHRPKRAKFPVVDVHVHPRLKFRHVPELLDAYVRVMDNQNIAVSVSLDGRLGEQTKIAIRTFEADRGWPITGDMTDALLQELDGTNEQASVAIR